VTCNIVDWGPGGILGAQRELVYFEAGLTATPFGSTAQVERGDVEAAIRNYQRPAELAQSALAAGSTATERIASVRETIDRAIDEVFGSSHDERALREVLVGAYVDAGAGHERAATTCI